MLQEVVAAELVCSRVVVGPRTRSIVVPLGEVIKGVLEGGDPVVEAETLLTGCCTCEKGAG